MTDKTKTVVVIEHHEQTIIRRTRRTMSSDEFPIAVEPGALVRPLGRAAVETDRIAQEKRSSLADRLKTIAMKSAPFLRRLKTSKRESEQT